MIMVNGIVIIFKIVIIIEIVIIIVTVDTFSNASVLHYS